MMNKKGLMMARVLFLSLTIGLLLSTLSVSAQSIVVKKAMKNGAGNYETNIVQGKSFGTKIKVGKKVVKLTDLKMNLTKDYPDDLTFVIKVYPIHNKKIDEAGLMETKTFTVKPNNKEVYVDLSGENLNVKGTILLSVEWKETAKDNSQLVLGSGFAKGGVYSKDKAEAEWKKIALFGLNIEVLGEREGN